MIKDFNYFITNLLKINSLNKFYLGLLIEKTLKGQRQGGGNRQEERVNTKKGQRHRGRQEAIGRRQY